MPTAAKKKYESPRQVRRQINILSTARTLLEEEGYTGMTMRGLAKTAGVAQGTLYNLYTSKDDLILAAVDDLLIRISKRTVKEAQADGIDAILVLARVTAEQVLATPKYADAMTRALFRSQPEDPMVEVLFARAYPFLVQELNTARSRGELCDYVDVEVVARQLVGQGWSVILLWLMGMLPIAEFVTERLRSDLMTLISVTKGSTRTRLEAQLRDL